MKRGINLLPEKELAEAKLESLQKKLLLISAIFLVILAIVTVAVFGLWRQQVQASQKIEQDLQSTIAEIKTYQRSEFLIKSLKGKTTKISEIIAQRSNFSKIMGEIESLIPDGISLTDIQITKDNKITITGKARNSFDLSNFLLGIINPDIGAKILGEVSVNKLAGAKDGTYQFAIVATIK